MGRFGGQTFLVNTFRTRCGLRGVDAERLRETDSVVPNHDWFSIASPGRFLPLARHRCPTLKESP